MSLLKPGHKLEGGRYEIVRSVGTPNMGAVYKAYDTERKIDRAIKQNLVITEDPAWFENEFQLLNKLDHPNLPQVHYYFIEDGYQYLVMDYIDGKNLRQLLNQSQDRKRKEEEVLNWTKQIMEALGYMHSRTKPIIHRDIKPANIILNKEGKIYLVDLGIAKEGITLLRGSGTPPYAPLEQEVRGLEETKTYSDIYSLGATLYHLLTGRQPPSASERKRGKTLVKPSEIVEIEKNTEDVILKAMKMEIKARYETIREMERALFPDLANSDKPEITLDEQNIVEENEIWNAPTALSNNNLNDIKENQENQNQLSHPDNRQQASKAGIDDEETRIGSGPNVTDITPKQTSWIDKIKKSRIFWILLVLLPILIGTMWWQPPVSPSTINSFIDSRIELWGRIIAPVETPPPSPTITSMPGVGIDAQLKCPEGMAPIENKIDSTNEIDYFCLDQYEVTNQAYSNCVTEGTCTPPKEQALWREDEGYSNYPVVNVTWAQAKTYCEEYLPTQYEGSDTLFFGLPKLDHWEFVYNRIDTESLNMQNILDQPVKVDDPGLISSPDEVYGLLYNVREWIIEWVPAPGGNPSARIARGLLIGKSFKDESMQTPFENHLLTEEFDDDWGFRCAADDE